MVNEDRLVKLFKQLCLIDAPALGERASVDFVKAHLISMGLEVSEDDAGAKIGGNAGNVVAWLRGPLKNAPKIFLSAHFDTVEPTAGLEIIEEDGVFKSRGDTILGADDKAGMAPAIEAVQTLIESGAPHGDVCLLFSVAEEIGLKGAAALEVQPLGLDFGYVLDTGPPVGSYVTKTATHDKLEVRVKGKPAHSGKDPEKGINAIQVAAHALAKMKLGRIGPETTANFGIIEGGTAVNVVCPEVRLRGEARSTSVEELDAQTGHMIACFEEACSRFGAKLEINHERHYGAYEISESSEVVRIAQAASRKLGLEPTLRTTLGGSDANIYNAKGLPCIVMATGMDRIHTHEEFVSRKDLVLLAELALETILLAAESRTAVASAG